MSYVDFMASVLMLMTAMAPATAVIQSRKFSNHQDLADVSFADGVTFESQARSTVDCLRICSAKSCCCRFTFVESGSIRGACRGYRTQLTYGSSRTSAVGSKTFVLLWEQTSGTPTNVTQHKKATQSTTRGTNYAGLAVDGNTDSNQKHGSCTHTRATAGAGSWWQVDLGASYYINSVFVTNRWDSLCSGTCAKRLRDFDIHVSSQNPSTDQAGSILCYHYNGPMGPGVTEELQCCVHHLKAASFGLLAPPMNTCLCVRCR